MLVTLAAKSRAEVWGSPVAHSLSPTLHNVAYASLGLKAHYDRREVSKEDLAKAVSSLDDSYMGVSLTMPLKEVILPLVADHRGQVDVLGAANTVVFSPGGLYLWNSDPAGVEGALRDAGIETVTHVVVLGAGATARSVISAVVSKGAQAITLASRDRERSASTMAFASSLGVKASWVPLSELDGVQAPDLVASTLPTGVDISELIPERLRKSAALFDVAYHPWPTALAQLWLKSGNKVISGLSMLTHQALIQVRLFYGGSAEKELPNESKVLSAMKQAVGLPAV